MILLEFTKRSTFVIVQSYTFNTKTTFPLIIFKKIFSSKMFPKFSVDTQNMAALREHSANIPRILHASWEMRVHVEGFMGRQICVQELARGNILHARNQCSKFQICRVSVYQQFFNFLDYTYKLVNRLYSNGRIDIPEKVSRFISENLFNLLQE